MNVGEVTAATAGNLDFRAHSRIVLEDKSFAFTFARLDCAEKAGCSSTYDYYVPHGRLLGVLCFVLCTSSFVL